MVLRNPVFPRSKRFRISFILLLFAIQLSLMVCSSWKKDYTFDEPNHLRYGQQILSSWNFERFDNSKMPISILNAAGLSTVKFFVKKPDGRLMRLASRLPTMLLGSLILFSVYRIAGRMFGGSAALASVFVVAFDPNLIAHARLVTTDVPVTAFIMVTFLLSLYYLKKPTVLNSILPGIFGGLSLLSKYSAMVFAVLFLTVVPVLLILDRVRSSQQNAWLVHIAVPRRMLHMGTWIFITVGTIWAGYGFSDMGKRINEVEWHTDHMKQFAGEYPDLCCPLPGPYLQGLDWCAYDDSQTVEVYSCGKKYAHPVRSYFFLIVLLKTPAGLMILWLLTIGSLCIYKFFRVQLLVILAPAIWFFCAAAFLLRTQIGLRYLLPFYPFMHVIAAGAFVPGRMRIVRCIGVLSLVWIGVSTLSFFPHYIPYCNEFIGNRLMLYRYISDSNIDWGQDLQAVDPAVQKYYGSPFSKAPEKPVPGIVCVRVDDLTGILVPWEKYEWLRNNYSPFGSVGYTYLLFDIPFTDIHRFRPLKTVFPLESPENVGRPGLTETVFRNPRSPIFYRSRVVYALSPYDMTNQEDIRSPFMIQWDGYLHVNKPGRYLIGVESDDGSHLWLDNTQYINNGGTHSTTFACELFSFSTGYYPLRIHYDDWGGMRFFKLYVVDLDRPDQDPQIKFFQSTRFP
jgi:Dolichyl-phosphate-mannose-protein mannosyltransferase/PA14 domain